MKIATVRIISTGAHNDSKTNVCGKLCTVSLTLHITQQS